MISPGRFDTTSPDAARAEAVLHLVTSPDVESGGFYDGIRPARAHREAYDPEARRRLRKLSRRLTGTG